MPTKNEIVEALRTAMAAPLATRRSSGCGRAYVCVSGNKEDIKTFAEACKVSGLMFLKKAYGTSGNALYIGYDNADGKALARADVVVAELTKHGVRAYADAVSD